MPCIGDTLAPRLIAEIGDVRRFHNKRALIAYAGIDAPPYQSGKFCANNRHISKRGNRYLRKTGYEVMQSYVMHKPTDDPVFTFIEKKRSEGKCGKVWVNPKFCVNAKLWCKIEQKYFKAGAAQAAAAFSTKITALRGDVKGGGVSLRSSRLLTFRLQPVSPACGRQRTPPTVRELRSSPAAFRSTSS